MYKILNALFSQPGPSPGLRHPDGAALHWVGASGRGHLQRHLPAQNPDHRLLLRSAAQAPTIDCAMDVAVLFAGRRRDCANC